ncbi:MAG: NAD-dependent epimerase/dehydratase family protein, partial [Candidatus Puniceispirillaceae bacterium]
MRILVTGVAGFIGMHAAMRLLADGHEVIGLDNINDYYDVCLKQARLAHIGSPNQFHFHKLDLADRDGMNMLFAETRPEIVINLAAQAGVRYSIENPHSYIDSNLVGFTNILEACRHFEVGHLVYASSSSVYGLNKEMPFHEGQNADHPLALYGATKKANELLAHSYSHLFNLPTTGLRLFTVYGPWGRPDMALFKFAEAILAGQAIDVYNHGQMTRDFTYIDDIVEGVIRLAIKPAQADAEFDAENPDAGRSSAPWRIF